MPRRIVVTVAVVLESAVGGLVLKSGLRIAGTATAGLLGVGCACGGWAAGLGWGCWAAGPPLGGFRAPVLQAPKPHSAPLAPSHACTALPLPHPLLTI